MTMFSKLNQYKELRDKAKHLQNALSGEKFEGSGAWGKVKVTIDGNQTVQSIAIDDDLMKPSEKSRLETGIKEALKDSMRRAQAVIVKKMKESGDFQIPGLTG